MRRTLRATRDAEASARAFRAGATRTRLLAESSYRDRFEDYLGVPRAASGAGPPAARAARARCTSTSTTARPTTASCCSTRSSAASAFSTRSSGRTTTAGAPSAAGRPSTTRSSSTSRTPHAYYFDSEEVDREPYMAPGLVTPEKAARGKLPTDVWWHTIVPTNGREKTGYPTQKPEGIVRRMVQRLDPTGGLVPGLLRRQRDARRGRRAARSPLRADRLQPRGRRDHARAAGSCARRGQRCNERPIATPRGGVVHGVRACGRCITSSFASFPITSAASTSPTRSCGVVEPWAREQVVESENGSGAPTRRGSRSSRVRQLAMEQLTMGRGWRAAQRESEDVTERVLDAARHAEAGRIGSVSPRRHAPAELAR